jgi:transposase-like protein
MELEGSMQRRKFSREFKLEAVNLVRERGVKVAQAARDLDVHEKQRSSAFRLGAQQRSGRGRHVHEVPLATILEISGYLAARLLVYLRRDADTTPLSQSFEPGGDIHAIAIDIRSLADDIAERREKQEAAKIKVKGCPIGEGCAKLHIMTWTVSDWRRLRTWLAAVVVEGLVGYGYIQTKRSRDSGPAWLLLASASLTEIHRCLDIAVLRLRFGNAVGDILWSTLRRAQLCARREG